MKANIKFIKEQFKTIADTHNLEWTSEDEYGVILKNEKISIKFITERWDEGIILSVTNRIAKKYYYPDDFTAKKGLDDRFDTILSKPEIDKIDNGEDLIVLHFRVLLEDYCPEILDGDFSQVGSGKPY